MGRYGRLLEGEAATRLLKLGRLDEADSVTDAALDLEPSLAKLVQVRRRGRGSRSTAGAPPRRIGC